MPTPRTTPEQHAATLALVERHGSVTVAADAVGINRETLSARFQKARVWRAACGEVGGPPIPAIGRPPEGFEVVANNAQYDADGNLKSQSVRTKRAAGEEYAVPEGHTVKGESTLLDADGRVVARWVKTKNENDIGAAVDALVEAFEKYEGRSPNISNPPVSDDDLLTLYPLPDLHFGMLSWGLETGTSYDIKIATEMAISSIETLVSMSRPSTHAILLSLGDFYHSDDQKNITPGSGHQLDVDSRWAKIFSEGAHLSAKMIEILASKHQFVEARWLFGNHDVNSAMCLTVALDMFYRNNPRISINTDPGVAYYRRFGECLIGGTHGHSAKMDRLPMMMASDRAQDWGQTKHRHFFTGHIHTETVKEVGGVRVESLQSPAARDAWNAASGYRSGRSLSAVTFHREGGEVGRHRINLFGSNFRKVA